MREQFSTTEGSHRTRLSTVGLQAGRHCDILDRSGDVRWLLLQELSLRMTMCKHPELQPP